MSWSDRCIESCQWTRSVLEERIHKAEIHPETHLMRQMRERKQTPAFLRDHTRPHLPEVTHMPDPFQKGPRGIHATAEDWESESSVSSKSSYSDDNQQRGRQRRSKRMMSKGSRSAKSGMSSKAASESGVSKSAMSSRHSVVSSASKRSVSFHGMEPDSDDGSVNSSEASGPHLPPGLTKQIESKARPPAAARMIRKAGEE